MNSENYGIKRNIQSNLRIRVLSRKRQHSCKVQGLPEIKGKSTFYQNKKDIKPQFNSLLAEPFQNAATVSSINAQKKQISRRDDHIQDRILDIYEYREKVEKQYSQNGSIDSQQKEALKIGELLRLKMQTNYLSQKNNKTLRKNQIQSGCQSSVSSIFSKRTSNSSLISAQLQVQQAAQSWDGKLNYKINTKQQESKKEIIYSDGSQQGDIEDNYYGYHGLSMANRIKMVDWMLQVLRVLQSKSLKTLIQAVNMMDKYYKVKAEQGEMQPIYEFHLIGLVCLFISSKFEEVKNITLKEIVNDAGHKKYSKFQILEKEQDVLMTLQFRIIIMDDLFEESNRILEQCFDHSKIYSKSNEEQNKLRDTVNFLSQLVPHCLDLFHQDIKSLSMMMVYIAVKLRKYTITQFIYENIHGGNLIVTDTIKIRSLKMAEDFYKFVKNEMFLMKSSIAEGSKTIYLKQFADLYEQIAYGQPARKNLRKNQAAYFNDITQEFFQHISNKYSD
ncbi:UNKNOWN [Stylonychia lemnae]|uniref:Cyclin-like domain-containing protein n=1 Tax=Stylonychia lemnae TaxID=5949 RepID=A0A078APC5_STYLE|nr:UNKNOWN [Stylonychia lemnae]|eukprot:CDW83796.1 UNKNOWN [Stylonychia lemnae]